MKKAITLSLIPFLMLILCFAAGETWQIGNAVIPFEIPTADGLIQEASFYDPFLRKTASTGKLGAYNGGTGCWAFGSYVYRQAFGTAFNKTKHRITPENQLTPVSEENLKYWILRAGPGAILRTTNQTSYVASDSDGHTMVIVHADNDGVTIYHGSGDGYIYYGNETRTFTWKEFSDSIQRGSVSSGKKNIKYVIYPGKTTFLELMDLKVESVSIQNAPVYLPKGQTVSLSINIRPEEAANRAVLWSSSNASVASVHQETGLIKALSPGKTEIRAAAADGGGAYDAFTLTVLPALSEFDFSLPEGVKIIESEAFSGVSAACVRLPDGAQRIESEAFSSCSSLTLIYIPKNIEFIAPDAFQGLDNVIFWTNSRIAMDYAKERGFETVDF